MMTNKIEDEFPSKEKIEKILKNVLNHFSASEEEKKKWEEWFDKIFFKPLEKANSKP